MVKDRLLLGEVEFVVIEGEIAERFFILVKGEAYILKRRYEEAINDELLFFNTAMDMMDLFLGKSAVSYAAILAKVKKPATREALKRITNVVGSRQ